MNIKPVTMREKVLYNLLIQGTCTQAELWILTGAVNIYTIIGDIVFKQGISVKYDFVSTIKSYTLIDYQKAAQVYEKWMTARYLYEQRQKAIISLYKEFPSLTEQEIADIMGVSRTTVSLQLKKYFNSPEFVLNKGNV